MKRQCHQQFVDRFQEMPSLSQSIRFLLLVLCLISLVAADDIDHLPDKSRGDVCPGGSDPLSVSRRTPDARLHRPTGSYCPTPTEAIPLVMAHDDKYGNKMVISLTPRLYDYVLNNVREHQILRQLREETAISQIQVSPDQGQLLAMLVEILGAERCIEVGVYTGYSSLAVALVLPESGRLVACDKDSNSLQVAKRYYELAGVSHKVTVKHGLAAETLMSMIQNGEESSYDFAFLDADKAMYQDYFELLLKLVRVGGVIVIDNVLWHGWVADPTVDEARTVNIRNFNKKLMDDKRVSISMVSIGDGMTICRKRSSSGLAVNLIQETSLQT